MEEKKENIIKRIFNNIKATWNRLGEPDVEDNESDLLIGDLAKTLDVEDRFFGENNNSNWGIKPGNTITIQPPSKEKINKDKKDKDKDKGFEIAE